MAIAVHSRAIRLFFSYASEDEDLCKDLKTHLSVLSRQGLIEKQHDSAISGGSDFRRPIESIIRQADIIVLLLSASFFASDRCYEIEMPCALEQQESRGVAVIPVMARPTLWTELPPARYQTLPANGKAISTWTDKDMAFVDVVQGISKVIETLPLRALNSLPRRPWGKDSFLWSVPYRENLSFTDRDVLLNTLHTYFATSQGIQPCIQALHGLGGVGKTQIAIEYTLLHHGDYQTILWLNASSRDLLYSDLTSLADLLDLTQQDRSDEKHLFAAVQRWLQHHDRWLCIFDNIDDVELMQELLPSRSSGHVLLTTNRRVPGTAIHEVSVIRMDTREGAILLLRRAGILKKEETWEDVSTTQQTLACEIVQELEGLPLAIDQAGAYINETRCDLVRYLALWRQLQTDMLDERGTGAHTLLHPDSVVVTLSSIFQRVEAQHPEALELLSLLAFFHPDAIPEEMIENGASELEGSLQMVAAHPIAFDRAIATLLSFALIQRQSDSTILSMHRMVQVVLLKRLTPERRRQFANQMIRLVARFLPKPYFDVWTNWGRYLSQAQKGAELIEEYRLEHSEAVHLLQHLGSYCYQHARYAEAASYLTSSLRLCEQTLGADHLDAAQSLNTLAQLYNQQGKYLEAEQLYQQSLAIRERELGPDDTITAVSLNNLAQLYASQGKYQQAEMFYQRVLAIEERVLGPEHPDTSTTLNNLGHLYARQGRYLLAEPLYQRAVSIDQQALDPRDPDLAVSISSLGSLYRDLGNYQQAEILFLRALALREENLHADHPKIALSLRNTASVYVALGKYQQAEAFYQRALKVYARTLEPDHPDIASCLTYLAQLYDTQEQYQQAEVLYQRALAINRKVLGTEHPETAKVLHHLGRLSRIRGEYEHAESLLANALATQEHLLGPEHPQTAQTLYSQAELLVDQKQYEQAELLFKQSLTIFQHVLGSRHPSSLRVQEGYAFLLKQMNRMDEATSIEQAEHPGQGESM